MAETRVQFGCILSGPERIPCDAVHVIECGHDSELGDDIAAIVVPGAIVLTCTLGPGHDGDFHHDIDGLWWRYDGGDDDG